MTRLALLAQHLLQLPVHLGQLPGEVGAAAHLPHELQAELVPAGLARELGRLRRQLLARRQSHLRPPKSCSMHNHTKRVVALLCSAQTAGRNVPSARAMRQRGLPGGVQEPNSEAAADNLVHVLAEYGRIACYRTFSTYRM